MAGFPVRIELDGRRPLMFPIRKTPQFTWSLAHGSQGG